MALEKNYTSQNGVVDTYHRIASITCNFEGEPSSLIQVRSYVSGDVRRNGTELFVREQSFSVQGTGGRAWAYEQLKQQPEFVDAVDV